MENVAILAAVAAFLLYSARANAIEGEPVIKPDTSDNSDGELHSDADKIAAFLYAIRLSEHQRADVLLDTDYFLAYARVPFSNMRDHPANTGEVKGYPLSADMCRRAGFPPGCVSTAAGAYQIIRPTWESIRAAGPHGARIPDFTPASQDEAATRLLRRAGAVDLLLADDFTGAVRVASGLWASLPGSTAGQGGRSLHFVAQAYDEGLNA